MRRRRCEIDIAHSVMKNIDMVKYLVAAHAVSGCDTVACLHGIGKGTVLKAISKGKAIEHLGDPDASMIDVISEATQFVATCYGVNNASTMSEARLKVWTSKAGKVKAIAPKLSTLPPTTEAFEEYIKRAHHQAMIWNAAKLPHPPTVDVEKFGWRKEESSRTLKPVMIPAECLVAPMSILELIKLNCSSQHIQCASNRCSCKNSALNCSVFCGCSNDLCSNEKSLV